MKIDTDLRLAIKAAERAQPHDDWQNQSKREQQSILDFFKRFPAKSKTAKRLMATAQRMEAAQTKAQKALCDLFGLRRSEGSASGFAYSHCGGNSDKFERAGGKVPVKHRRWKVDEMIAKLAAATPAEGRKIIKQLGINWS